MTNDNNKIKELEIDDEDPTVALEALTFAQDGSAHVELESDAKTHDAPAIADRKSNGVTNDRLQYDVEQLQSRRLGLETEIKARGEQVDTLNQELTSLLDTQLRKEKLLKKRDSKIKLLKSEIRQRDEQFRSLSSQFIALQQTLTDAAASADEEQQSKRSNDYNLTPDDLIRKLARSESYADSIRQQLQDMIASLTELQSERDHLARSLATTRHRNDDFSGQIDTQNTAIEGLKKEILSVKDQHSEEIRILRFELGEAQNTVIEAEDLNSQLASDLVDTSHFKDELERMLSDAEEQAESKVAKLRKQIRKQSRTIENNEQKISTKSGAITVLLSELAKKPGQLEHVADIENVIKDVTPSPQRPTRKRITRVLVGKIGGQKLRFPLFKDKLTIGRTADNDIQLNASYISRRHAVIQTEGDTTRVIDWGSKNGVHVNSKLVKEHFLTNGDILAIGNARFRYEERKKHES